MTITEMAVPLNETKESQDESCPNLESEKNSTTKFIKGGTYEWSEYTQVN